MLHSTSSTLPRSTPSRYLFGEWQFQQDPNDWSLRRTIPMALALHVLVLLAVAVFMLLAQLFNWQLPLFDLAKLKPRDIEFVLVDAQPAKPRDPNTRNRSDRNTRSGGQAVPNMPKAEPQRTKGPITPQPNKAGGASNSAQTTRASQPSRAPQQPQQQPTRPTAQPPKTQQPTQQQPRQNNTQSPMSPPKATRPPAPKPTPAPVRPAKPVPRAPVQLPSPASTEEDNTLPPGPILNRSAGAGRSGAAVNAPRPSQIPGGVSRPSSQAGIQGNPGALSGGGGQGTFNQYGSPGGGGGAPGIDALAEPDFGPYIAELQRRIKRNWSPPADNQNKRIVTVFTVSRDGRLVGVRIVQGSGIAVADQAAVQAIQASAPFRPLPPNYRGSTIDVQFTFDYNVLSGVRR